MPTVITGANLVLDTTFVLGSNPKVFSFTDNTNYSGASIPLSGVRGVLEITSPSGVIVYNNTSYGASSDIVANISLTNAIPISLPCLSNQAPEQGTYTVVYTVRIIDGSNPTYYISQTNSYIFSYTSPVVCIVPQVDCISPLFTVSDTTDYVVNSITPTNTRTITLEFPANSGGTTLTNTTSATITTSTFYNGLQVTTVSSVLSYAFSNFTVTDTVEGTKSTNVDCSYVCELFCCLNSLNNQVCAARGVNDILFEQLEAKFSQSMNLLELLFLSIDCGKQTTANSLIAYIRTLANCTSDCSCTDGTPSLVTGLGNLTNVNVIVQSGGSPITVASTISGGVTTYTVSFSAALVTKINSSYNTVVTNVDGTITVSPSGVINDVQTYTISANYPAAQNRLEFLCRIQYTVPGAPVCTITNSNYLYSGSNIPGTATVANSTIALVNGKNLNNLFTVSAFQTSANNNYKVTITPIYMGLDYTVYGKVKTVSAANIYNLGKVGDLMVLNKASGTFDFSFVDIYGNPLTNNLMTFYTDIVLNIKISQ